MKSALQDAALSTAISLLAYGFSFVVTQPLANALSEAGVNIPIYAQWVMDSYRYYWMLSSLGLFALLLSLIDQRYSSAAGRLAEVNTLLAFGLSLASVSAVYLVVVFAPMDL